MSAKLMVQRDETNKAQPDDSLAAKGSPAGVAGLLNSPGDRTMRKIQSSTLTERVIGFLESYGESLYA